MAVERYDSLSAALEEIREMFLRCIPRPSMHEQVSGGWGDCRREGPARESAMTIKRPIFLTIFCLQLTAALPALDHNAEGVFVRVVDVGDGHCAVVKMPDDHYMIYDDCRRW